VYIYVESHVYGEILYIVDQLTHSLPDI